MLYPHQEAFVDAAINARSHVLLRAETGLGKITAFVALVDRLLKQEPNARVLFLLPGPIQQQAALRLREEGVNSVTVDRYRFREMLDRQGSTNIWTAGTAFVLGRDFAKQNDVCDSLVTVPWSLIIVDEAHGMAGLRADALRRIAMAASRVVLALPLHAEVKVSLPGEMVTIVWRRDHSLLTGGESESKEEPRGSLVTLREHPYGLSPDELSLRATVTSLVQALELASEDVSARTISLALDSSPAALEPLLRRLDGDDGRISLMDSMTGGAEQGRLLDDPAEIPSTLLLTALDQLDALNDDSKLSAFLTLLGNLDAVESGASRSRICVLTKFASTAFYLATAVEDHGLVSWPISRDTSPADRDQANRQFSAEGGVLIMNAEESGEWIETSWVASDIVLYDWGDDESQLVDSFREFVGVHAAPSSPVCVRALVLSPDYDSPTTATLVTLRRVLRDAFAEHRGRGMEVT